MSTSRTSRVNGRIFTCGDIHGCVDELKRELDRAGFDKTRDRLIALGDLVDRGPDSAGAVRLLDEPWFESIMGNHEEMMIAGFDGDPEMQGCHLMNGGGWFACLSEDEQAELVERVRGLPYALTVETPSGLKIGLVHADFPGDDWEAFMGMLETPQVRDYAVWSRERVGNAKYRDARPAKNVDQVFFGHTPLREPLTVHNLNWIDTGCFASGRLTLVELL